MKPLLLINLKAFEQGTGKGAAKLAGIARRFAKSQKYELVLAAQPTDISTVAKAITTYAQHIDSVEYGSFTGHILPEAVKAAGAVGTLINHSENPLSLEEVEKCIARAKKCGLVTVCCAPNPKAVERIARMGPDYVAVEPPELIGGTISVSTAKPEVIRKSVELVKRANPKVKVLCGAGIHNKEDVKIALKLGTHGILVASAIVKSDDPARVIKELADGY
jgi:triosephosphate isomerase